MRVYIVSAYADTALKNRFERLAKADRIKGMVPHIVPKRRI